MTRSAFTGADDTQVGRIAATAGGTLFLDEIGELAPAVQGKLLRVLEERTVQALGATHPTPVDLRLVVATNRDLAQAVATGEFRKDLYHRIAVLLVELPPLRERDDDVIRLAEAFLIDISNAMGRLLPALSAEALHRRHSKRATAKPHSPATAGTSLARLARRAYPVRPCNPA